VENDKLGLVPVIFGYIVVSSVGSC